MVKMKASVVVFIVGMVPGLVFAEWGDSYFGKTIVDTGNLSVAVRPFRELVPMVGLENRSDIPVRCSATFSNGPQFSETRLATVLPGKRATVGYGVGYITAKVDIDVKCTPLQQPQRAS
jgi:hypothetical protein